MVIRIEDLEILKKVYGFIKQKKSNRIFLKLEEREGLHRNDVIKGLAMLNKLKLINSLKISGNVFSCKIEAYIDFTVEYLMDYHGFNLHSQDEENNAEKKLKNKISYLERENLDLHKKIKELGKNLNTYASSGKSFQKLIEDSKVCHGQ